jgi:hypothetical protein
VSHRAEESGLQNANFSRKLSPELLRKCRGHTCRNSRLAIGFRPSSRELHCLRLPSEGRLHRASGGTASVLGAGRTSRLSKGATLPSVSHARQFRHLTYLAARALSERANTWSISRAYGLDAASRSRLVSRVWTPPATTNLSCSLAGMAPRAAPVVPLEPACHSTSYDVLNEVVKKNRNNRPR